MRPQLQRLKRKAKDETPAAKAKWSASRETPAAKAKMKATGESPAVKQKKQALQQTPAAKLKGEPLLRRWHANPKLHCDAKLKPDREHKKKPRYQEAHAQRQAKRRLEIEEETFKSRIQFARASRVPATKDEDGTWTRQVRVSPTPPHPPCHPMGGLICNDYDPSAVLELYNTRRIRHITPAPSWSVIVEGG